MKPTLVDQALEMAEKLPLAGRAVGRSRDLFRQAKPYRVMFWRGLRMLADQRIAQLTEPAPPDEAPEKPSPRRARKIEIE